MAEVFAHPWMQGELCQKQHPRVCNNGRAIVVSILYIYVLGTIHVASVDGIYVIYVYDEHVGNHDHHDDVTDFDHVDNYDSYGRIVEGRAP